LDPSSGSRPVAAELPAHHCRQHQVDFSKPGRARRDGNLRDQAGRSPQGRRLDRCLKLDARGNPQHYAIFIQGNKVIDQRAGIVMDQCYKETYTPFELPVPAKKPTTACSGGTGAGSASKACATQ
jgi:hypothetical protein